MPWLSGPDQVKDQAADAGRNVPAGRIICHLKPCSFICGDQAGDLLFCFERIEVRHAAIGQERQQAAECGIHAVGCGDDEPVERRREGGGVECIPLPGYGSSPQPGSGQCSHQATGTHPGSSQPPTPPHPGPQQGLHTARPRRRGRTPFLPVVPGQLPASARMPYGMRRTSLPTSIR